MAMIGDGPCFLRFVVARQGVWSMAREEARSQAPYERVDVALR